KPPPVEAFSRRSPSRAPSRARRATPARPSGRPGSCRWAYAFEAPRARSSRAPPLDRFCFCRCPPRPVRRPPPPVLPPRRAPARPTPPPVERAAGADAARAAPGDVGADALQIEDVAVPANEAAPAPGLGAPPPQLEPGLLDASTAAPAGLSIEAADTAGGQVA